MKIDSKIIILVIAAAAVTTPTTYYYYTFKKNNLLPIFIFMFLQFLLPHSSHFFSPSGPHLSVSPSVRFFSIPRILFVLSRIFCLVR